MRIRAEFTFVLLTNLLEFIAGCVILFVSSVLRGLQRDEI